MTKTLFRMVLLLAAATVLVASEDGTVTVPAGSVLRSQLEETVRIQPGARVSAKLAQPLYVGEALVFGRGTILKGEIHSITPLPFANRKRRLLVGDFTPPRIARVTFHQIVLPDGALLPISTIASIGAKDIRTAVYLPHPPRSSVKQKISDATRPLTEPGKLQRVSRAALKALPYHPEFLDRGVVFDSALLVELKTMPIALTEAERRGEDGVLHARLLTPLDSSSVLASRPVKAVVLRPYYGADGRLLYPEGTTVAGTVRDASPSGNWKKHGALRLEFQYASVAGREPVPLKATVSGVEAPHPNSLSVDKAGWITARNSRAGQVLAFASMVGPGLGAADPSSNKTAFARAGQGPDFGLVGMGAAQASSSTATGIGFAGAAIQIYDRVFAHGAEIKLPENTPILLRIVP